VKTAAIRIAAAKAIAMRSGGAVKATASTSGNPKLKLVGKATPKSKKTTPVVKKTTPVVPTPLTSGSSSTPVSASVVNKAKGKDASVPPSNGKKRITRATKA
jgi:hypothetical protein